MALEVGQEDQELVAALARDHVHLPDRRPQPRSDRLQQLVPGRMPEAVVDELEVVQIDEQNRRTMARPAGPSKGQLQMLQERGPVRQARQRVVERSIGELLHRLRLNTLAVGDVGDHPVDKQTAVFRRGFGPHPVERPARLAVVADQPILHLHRLAVPEHHHCRVVGLPILRMYRRLIRLLRRQTLGNRSNQGLEPDERQTFEAAIRPQPHLVQHDRDRASDPLQKLRAISLELRI